MGYTRGLFLKLRDGFPILGCAISRVAVFLFLETLSLLLFEVFVSFLVTQHALLKF